MQDQSHLAGIYPASADFVAHAHVDGAMYEAMYAAFFHELLDRRVAIAPGAYEVMFPGLAHNDEVLTAISDAVHAAAAAVASQ